MSNRNLIVLFLALCFGLTSSMAAQETPMAPPANSEPLVIPHVDESKQESKQDPDVAESDAQDDDAQDDDAQDSKQADEKKANEKKSDNQNADKKRSPRRSIWTRNSLRVGEYSKQSEDFIAVFKPVVASSNESAIKILSGKRQVALGTVVDADGLVLTKASELRGELFCKLDDGEVVKATVIGIHPESDLALLKIEADQLTAVQWSETSAPVVGNWIATPKANKDEPMIGVVSVNVRVIPPSSPYMGITMIELKDQGGVRINSVESDSPADDAGLLVTDVILEIDEASVKDIKGLKEILGNYDVNDRVTILVRRFGKEKTLKLTLGARDKVSSASQRSNMQNDMGSKLSRRRKDFPEAFQHDSMLNSNTCGGPIVDLSGKVVGINIARAGRVSSLSLPVATVLPILASLKTGEWAPEVVNKEKIESIDAELKEIAVVLGRLPDKKNVLEQKYGAEKARVEEIEKSIKGLQERLKVIDEKSKTFKKELGSVDDDIQIANRNRKRLLNELERLKGGGR